MALDQQEIVQTLLAARMRISAAAWLIVRDAQTGEDIFQDVSVKARRPTCSLTGSPNSSRGARSRPATGPSIGFAPAKSASSPLMRACWN